MERPQLPRSKGPENAGHCNRPSANLLGVWIDFVPLKPIHTVPQPTTSSTGDSPINHVDHLRKEKLKYEPSFEKSEKLNQLKDLKNQSNVPNAKNS